METNILIILIAITSIISFYAFDRSEILNKYALSPYLIKNNKESYRLFSHMFLHGDFTHLLFNMMSLYFLGKILLDEFDYYYPLHFSAERHFLSIYVLGGLASSAVSIYRHQSNPNYQSIGASGAVSAIIFATILWNPTMKLMLFFIPIPIPAYLFGPLYLLFEYYAMKRGGGNIAHDAHIGGALMGIIYVLILNIDKGKEFIQLIF